MRARPPMNYDYYRYFLRGWIFHFFGRNDIAFDAYADAFRHDPNAFQPACSLAFIAAGRKDYKTAERWFREALRIHPDDGDTWFNLAYVLGEDSRHEAAIKAFREAVRLKPQQDRAWYGMGLTLAKSGDHGGAAAAFRKATDLQPMNGVAWYQLGMAHHHCHDPETVAEVIRHLHTFEPKFCRRLVKDAERSDLEHLIKDMIV